MLDAAHERAQYLSGMWSEQYLATNLFSKVSLKTKRRSFFLPSLIGNALEYYDFTIFAVFSAEIAKQFFPQDNDFSEIIFSLAVFAVGFVMRPIGAIIFGHIGDKVGRKKALTLSISCMAIPTLMIGLLPGYASIGVLAALLLVLLRLIQGLSIGGEGAGSAIFILEHNQTFSPGYLGGIITASNFIGAFLATLIGLLISYYISNMQGWRLAFILGGLLGVVGFYLRLKTLETPIFEKIVREKAIVRLPMVEAISNNKRQMLLSLCLGGLVGAFAYMILAYINVFLAMIACRNAILNNPSEFISLKGSKPHISFDVRLVITYFKKVDARKIEAAEKTLKKLQDDHGENTTNAEDLRSPSKKESARIRPVIGDDKDKEEVKVLKEIIQAKKQTRHEIETALREYEDACHKYDWKGVVVALGGIDKKYIAGNALAQCYYGMDIISFATLINNGILSAQTNGFVKANAQTIESTMNNEMEACRKRVNEKIDNIMTELKKTEPTANEKVDAAEKQIAAAKTAHTAAEQLQKNTNRKLEEVANDLREAHDSKNMAEIAQAQAILDLATKADQAAETAVKNAKLAFDDALEAHKLATQKKARIHDNLVEAEKEKSKHDSDIDGKNILTTLKNLELFLQDSKNVIKEVDTGHTNIAGKLEKIATEANTAAELYRAVDVAIESSPVIAIKRAEANIQNAEKEVQTIVEKSEALDKRVEALEIQAQKNVASINKDKQSVVQFATRHQGNARLQPHVKSIVEIYERMARNAQNELDEAAKKKRQAANKLRQLKQNKDEVEGKLKIVQALKANVNAATGNPATIAVARETADAEAQNAIQIAANARQNEFIALQELEGDCGVLEARILPEALYSTAFGQEAYNAENDMVQASIDETEKSFLVRRGYCNTARDKLKNRDPNIDDIQNMQSELVDLEVALERDQKALGELKAALRPNDLTGKLQLADQLIVLSPSIKVEQAQQYSMRVITKVQQLDQAAEAERLRLARIEELRLQAEQKRAEEEAERLRLAELERRQKEDQLRLAQEAAEREKAFLAEQERLRLAELERKRLEEERERSSSVGVEADPEKIRREEEARREREAALLAAEQKEAQERLGKGKLNGPSDSKLHALMITQLQESIEEQAQKIAEFEIRARNDEKARREAQWAREQERLSRIAAEEEADRLKRASLAQEANLERERLAKEAARAAEEKIRREADEERKRLTEERNNALAQANQRELARLHAVEQARLLRERLDAARVIPAPLPPPPPPPPIVHAFHAAVHPAPAPDTTSLREQFRRINGFPPSSF